ncbi:hypothetical protein [Gordonia sp. FQ]|uniref:hypothetical protein n=1 Tax=Gordonia sp. FQ TaxID=3446634 RepID=UPI003F83F12A
MRTVVGSRIEGIGRQRVEPGFLLAVVDRMVSVPDAAAVAAIAHLEAVTGRRAGASTGTGLWAAYRIVGELRDAGRTGSVVALLCDSGDRYVNKYYCADWLVDEGLDPAPYAARLERFFAGGGLD